MESVDGISPNNFHIIGFIARNGDRAICQRDIEKEFCITRSTVSRVLSLMEQKGLVERVGVEGDARLKRLVLTERSRRFVEKMHTNFEEAEAVLTKGFTAEELEEFFRLVEKMKENIHSSDKQQ